MGSSKSYQGYSARESERMVQEAMGERPTSLPATVRLHRRAAWSLLGLLLLCAAGYFLPHEGLWGSLRTLALCLLFLVAGVLMAPGLKIWRVFRPEDLPKTPESPGPTP